MPLLKNISVDFFCDSNWWCRSSGEDAKATADNDQPFDFAQGRAVGPSVWRVMARLECMTEVFESQIFQGVSYPSCENKGLIEATLGGHEPLDLFITAGLQHSREFITQQAAILRNKVMRCPDLLRLDRDVKV